MKIKNSRTSIFVLILFFVLSCQSGSDKESDEPEVDDTIYAEHVRTSEYQTPEEEMQDFILPPGFEVTLFASEPDITKPINMAFDEKGRLWVSQSSEYPVAAGPSEGRDRITILEDTDGDGRADVIQDFARDLNIPIGIMPVKDGAIAYSIPNIYRFLDTNEDDRADQREVLLGEFEHKDTHGMVNNLFRGFDGWIHASHGFSNVSVVEGKDGHSVKMTSGNTFRFKMDGSRIEKTTDGRINPFGSDYDEMGYHYSADCHTLPIYQLIWGGNYPQWGKKTPNMGFAPDMMDYGLNSTALSGLVYYTDDRFPEEYQNSFYSGDVVTCRISRSTMEFNGSTPKATRQEDFLVSKDPWFRPVDIKIGPDGAMYVADFYNRIIGHYEVPLDHPGRDRVSGRIWKITYKGNQREVTDWSEAGLEELIQGMGHNVLHQRMMATDELVDRFGEEALHDLLVMVDNDETDPVQLIQGNWALFRLEVLPDKLLRRAVHHEDQRVRVHAYKLLSNYPTLNREQREWAIRDLEDEDPHVQRAAAELLSRHPHSDSYKKLVTLHAKVPEYDTHLAYTILLALSNHLEDKKILQLAIEGDWEEDEAKLVALVMSDLSSPEVGDYLLKYLQAYTEPKEKSIAYTESIARNVEDSGLDELLQLTKKLAADDQKDTYRWAMAIAQGLEQKGSTAPATVQAWYKSLVEDILTSVPGSWTEEDISRLRYAAETAGKYKLGDFSSSLKEIVSKKGEDEDTRALAARALMQIDPKSNAEWLAQLVYEGEEETGARRKFAASLGINEEAPVRELLGEGLRNAPTELQETIASILVRSPEGKSQIMDLIKKGYAPARILKARLVEEPLLANISEAQKTEYEALTANLEPVSEERQKIVEKRLAEFDPDENSVTLGSTVFEKHCGMCHQIDNKGGLIGPQLDGIGNWGKEALATKILDPNRNISENFRNYNIRLKNGQNLSGLYRREEGQMLVLASQTGEEFTVPIQEIQEQTVSKYTLMPDNFDTSLPKEEFEALMVYLLNEK